MKPALPRGWRLAPALAWLAVIGVLTLTPTPQPLIPLPMFCLACGDLGGVDVVLNVALFVPLGAALALAGVPAGRAVLAGFLVSLAIEGLQFSLVPGRDASLSDLLTNTAGTALGAGIAARWRLLLAPSRDQAPWMSGAALSATLGVLAFTAYLLRPTVPPMGLWGQWTPQQLQFEPYSGTVHEFQVNGIAVPYNLVPESEPLRQRILEGETLARATITTGEPTRKLAVITRLGSRVQEVLLLGIRGTDLVFRMRMAARDWRLRPPSIAVPGALPQAGERVTIEGGVRQRRWFATVHGTRGKLHREVPFSIALGWTMLLPFDHPVAPADVWWSALWLAALALPAATWGAQAGLAAESSRQPSHAGFNAWWLAVTVVLMAGTWQVVRLADFVAPSAIEWAGLAAGMVAGALAGPRLVRWVREYPAPTGVNG